MAVFAAIQSGFICSSAFVLEKPERPFTIFADSQAAASISLQFATSDPRVGAVASAAFFTLLRGDSTGFPYVAYSASAPGVTWPIAAPTPYCRILLNAGAAGTRSYTILPAIQIA